MKTIVFTTLFVIALGYSLVGCTDRFERVNRKYVLENGTAHELRIDFYQFGVFKTTNKVLGQGIIAEGISSNDAGSGISAADAISADSVVITFNEKKRQIYYYSDAEFVFKGLPNSQRNILIDSVYKIENNELYRFTFTDEDYETAEEIGG